MPITIDRLPKTPIGPLWLAISERGLLAVGLGGSQASFVRRLPRELRAGTRRAHRPTPAAAQLRDILSGQRKTFDLPLDWRGVTPFRARVLRLVSRVPRGRVTTYGALARRLGLPGAGRAVGQALAANCLPLVVPCHRVLASDGSLGGYIRGTSIKRKLLDLEAALPA